MTMTAEGRHSDRFRKVSNRYPLRVTEAYEGDLERAMADSDEQVAATVATWERHRGLQPRDWAAIGAAEREPSDDDAATQAAIEAEREARDAALGGGLMTTQAHEPVVVKVNAARFGATLVEEIKAICAVYPGDTGVLLEMDTREGPRGLQFGDEYRVRPSVAFYAELLNLLVERGAISG